MRTRSNLRRIVVLGTTAVVAVLVMAGSARAALFDTYWDVNALLWDSGNTAPSKTVHLVGGSGVEFDVTIATAADMGNLVTSPYKPGGISYLADSGGLNDADWFNGPLTFTASNFTDMPTGNITFQLMDASGRQLTSNVIVFTSTATPTTTEIPTGLTVGDKVFTNLGLDSSAAGLAGGQYQATVDWKKPMGDEEMGMWREFTFKMTVLPATPAYWDLNGTTAGAGGPAPASTWNAANTNWNAVADGTGSTAAWTSGLRAVFAAGTDATGTYTVTVDGTRDIGDLTFEEGTVTLTPGSAGAIRLTGVGDVEVASGLTATIATPISEDVAGRGLHKSGSGTLVLSGAGSYTGKTTVQDGTLRLGADNVLPDASDVTVSGNAAAVTGTLDLAGYSDTIGSLTLGGATPTSAAAVTTGAGTLTLGGDVTYGNTYSPSVCLGATVSGKLDLGAATRTFTVNDSPAAADDLTVSADISGTGVGLTKAGAGMLVLSGTNTYTGATGINTGTLSIGNASTFTNTSAINLSGTGRLNVYVANQSLAKLASPTGTGVAAGTFLRYSQAQGSGTTGPGTILGTVELNLTNVNPNYVLDFGTGGTLTNLVTSTYTSALTLSGSASIDSSTAVATYSTGGITASSAGAKILSLTGTNTGVNTIAGAIGDGSGTVGIAKSGAGAWVLSGANTYTGATTISAGTLSVAADNNLGGANSLVFDGGTLRVTGTALTDFGTHTPTFNAGKNVVLDIADAGNKFTVIQVMNQTTGGLTKIGAGTLVLSNASNSYTGVTTISAGTLSVSKLANGGSPSGIGASTNVSTNLLLGNGTTLKYIGAGDSTDRQFRFNGNLAGLSVTLDASGSGPINFTSATGPSHSNAKQTRTLKLIGSNTGNNTLAAPLANNGTSALSVVKDGVGTWVLSGASTYTGGTTVSAGKLLLGQGGSMGATAVSVTGEASYGTSYESSGNAIAGGSTLSLAGGTMLDMRDTNTNTLKFTTTGALSGANLYFDLGTAANDCDILALVGASTVTNTNTFYFNVLGGSLKTGDHAYTLITAASGLSTGGTFAIDTTLPEYTLTPDAQDGAVYLNVALSVLPGDVNRDRVVDAADYIIVKQNFGMTGATWSQGNISDGVDGVGTVDWDDLQILMAKFGTRSIGGAPAAPEPATLGLLAIGAAAMLRRRRRAA